MKQCPDPDCPYLRRHGRRAEYRDEIERCGDCGATLTDVAPAPVTAPPPGRYLPWRELLVTLAVPLAVWLLGLVPLATVSHEHLGMLTRFGGDSRQLGVFALGITPLILAYVLVELVAALVPRWRPLRLSGPAGRAVLERRAAVVAILICAVQGWSVALFLESYAELGMGELGPLVPDPGLGFRLLTMLSLTAGTLLLWPAARLIGRYGLGNGFSVLIAATIVPDLLGGFWRVLASDGLVSPAAAAAWLGLCALMAVIAGRMLRPAPATAADPALPSLRTPAAGSSPLEILPALVGLDVAARSFGLFDPGASHLWWLETNTPALLALGSAVVIAGTFGFAWLFNQPRRVAAAWAPWLQREPPALVSSARNLLWRSARVAAGWLVLLFVLQWLTSRMLPEGLSSALVVCVLVAVFLDLRAEWRARRNRGQLVAVWPVHQVYLVDVLVARLAERGLSVFPRAAAHRTLLQFFGPFVPIELLSTPEQAEGVASTLRPGETRQ